MRKCYLLLLLLFLGMGAMAQNRIITGVVKDDVGEPLPGVSIVVKGTTTGTVSGVDGFYSINMPADKNVLLFSYTGFETQEIEVGDQESISIALVAGIDLEEVVVVGYGTQEKVNLTGSVEVIEGAEIARQPVFQTSQALAGLAPGLVATQSSGQPGADAATLRIRGVGTIGDGDRNNPLVLVDGIPDNLNGVDPNDIETISVLKDASAAAIYGSRAANGVILITTKRGKAGQIRFNYSNHVGFQRIAQNLEFEDAVGYMTNFNKAEPGAFEEDFINNYNSNSVNNPDEFPNTDWVDRTFSETGVQQYHRLAINGGSEKVRVAASLSYMDQNGNIPNFDFTRYNGRFNTDFQINEKFNINFDLNFRRTLRDEPSAGLQNITRQTYRIPPIFRDVNSDGSWGEGWNGTNPLAHTFAGGLREQEFNYFRGVLKATYSPIEGLRLSMTYAPQYNDDFDKEFTARYRWFDLPVSDTGLIPNVNSLRQNNGRSFQDNFNTIVTFDRTFGIHQIGATAGYEFLKLNDRNFSAFRDNFILQEFQELNQGSAANAQNSGSSTENGLQSWFGRVNYILLERYLFEVNIRRDASSRFAAENRVSVFPSFSVGWRISEEAFLAGQSLVSNLKLRASWGELGNQQIGNNFPYQSLINIGADNYFFGGNIVTGGSQRVLANRGLQWETTTTANIGLDFGFLNNRLTGSFDYYVRTTQDILLEATIPLSVGLNPPFQNVGEVENRGWDLALEWRDNIGQVGYGVRANLSDVKNKVTNLGGLDELPPGNTIVRVGEPINAIYGYEVSGFFQSQNEVDEAPTQFGLVRPGDLRYVDVNGDGNITPADDRLVIGSDIPRLTYGVDLFVNYQGFDLTIAFLGVGKRQIVLQGDAAYAFSNAGKIQTWMTDSWTPENTDASYPALFSGSDHNNWRTNSFWVFDASYLRLRNVTLGYTFPKALLENVFLESVRLYASGQNLLTFDNMPDGIDPTVPNFTDGGFYPLTSVYTLGLNISF